MTYSNTTTTYASSADFIHEVTDDILRERDGILEPLLVRYKDWLSTSDVEELRSDEEYTRDALTLGILWRCYGQRVIGMPAFNAWILSSLKRLRRFVGSQNDGGEGGGGKLARQLLQLRSRKANRPGLTSPCEIMALMFWLDAIGVYGDEVQRLTPLCTFLVEIDSMESEWHLARLSAFTARVMMICEQKLPEHVLREGADAIEGETRNTGWLAALAGTPAVEEQYLRVLELELMRRAEEGGEQRNMPLGGYTFELSPA